MKKNLSDKHVQSPDQQSALILSVSKNPLKRPSRELRQARTLKKNGWHVFVAGWVQGAPNEGFSLLPLVPIQRTLWKKLHYLFRGKHFSWLERFIEAFAGTTTHVYSALQKVAQHQNFNLIIAHDYYTLPVGFVLAKQNKCPFILDAHEYALTQNDHKVQGLARLKWWLQKRYVAFVQAKYLPHVHAVTTVSKGIAETLQKTYPFLAPPVVIRSLPFYQKVSLRKTDPNNRLLSKHSMAEGFLGRDDRATTAYLGIREDCEGGSNDKSTRQTKLQKESNIKLLYHGFLVPERGIETCLRVLSLLDARWSLTLRGDGEASYMAALKKLTDTLGVQERVSFELPASTADLIHAAHQHDIGLYVPASEQNPQVQHVLPNKFFEYIAAGLMVGVADFPAMRALVDQYKLGLTFSDSSPQKIAEKLSTLTPERIDQYKKNALEAAKVLCWEQEEQKFEKLVQKLTRKNV